jgi:hypothetical protein
MMAITTNNSIRVNPRLDRRRGIGRALRITLPPLENGTERNHIAWRNGKTIQELVRMGAIENNGN